EPVVSFVVPVVHAELLEDGYVRLALPEIWLPTDSNYVVELRSNGWSLPPNPGLRIGLDLVRARGHSQLIQARGEALRLLDVIEPGEGDGISWQGKGPSEWINEAKRRLAAGRFEEAVDALLIA